MADRDKVDELVIELTARDKATQKIDNLAKSLRGLGDSLTTGLSSAKMNSVASSLKSISSATQELGRSTKAINNLPKLTSELSNMMNSLHDAPSISKDVLSLAHALSRIDGSTIKGFSKIASPKVNSGSAVQEMKAVESEAKKVDSQTKEVTQTVNKFGTAIKTALKGVPSTLKKVSDIDFGKLNQNLNSILGKVGKLAGGVKKLHDRVSLTHKLHNTSLKKGFTTLLRYTVGIRSLFVLANRIRSAIEDGNKNLSKYSAEFNTSMSRYKSGLGTLKNAMSVAFAPLVNYFSDAVNRILDSFINAFNTIARLMATLTGAKQVVQATRYYEDYAKSLDKSSKSAKQLTTGIDELNILNEKSGGGSGGASTDVQDMFETVEVTNEFDSWINNLKEMWDKSDFTDLGTSIADKINGGLQNIDWKNIKTNARKIGKSLATFLNGAFEEELNGQSLGYTVGQTIGEAINTGIDFGYEFATTFHWDSFGQAIADLFKGGLETVDWRKGGATLSAFVNGFLDSLITFFDDDTLWEDVGQSIGEFFSGIEWKESWFKLKELAKTIASATKTALKSWAEEDPESFGIATAIAVAIGGIKVASLVAKINGTTLATTIGTALTTVIADNPLVLPITIGVVASVVGAKVEYDYATDKDPMKNYIAGIPGLITMWQRAGRESETFSGRIENLGKQFSYVGERAENSNMIFGSWISDFGSGLETFSQKYGGTLDKVIKDAEDTFSILKTNLSTKWEDIKIDADQKWSGIKESLSKKFTDIKVDASLKFGGLKTSFVNAFTGMKNGIKTPINAIIGFVESMVNKIIDGFNGASDVIKNFTSFEWTNPVTGTNYKSNGLSLPKAEHISIKRLADGGFVPNSNMGSLFWAGESGAEVVAHANGGTEVLNATQVADAVSSGVRQAIVDAIMPYMVDLVNSNQVIADKDFAVNLGDRQIAEANRRGESQLGLQIVSIG